MLGGESQTDKLFDHEIVEHMGRDFYEQVFAPAVREARASGQTYEAVRDLLRRRWKPSAAAAAESELDVPLSSRARRDGEQPTRGRSVSRTHA